MYSGRGQVSLTESRGGVAVSVRGAIIRRKGSITVAEELADRAIDAIDKALLTLIGEVRRDMILKELLRKLLS